MTQKKPSLHFVTAINFELTYACNMSCPHCLQEEIRQRGDLSWIDTESAIRCLVDGKELGFTTSGVNLTGGEPFLRGSNLPELLTAANSLTLDVRVNTNGWWGGHQDIQIGNETFPSSRDVVKWLKSKGVVLLALSIDQRYDTNIASLNSVSTVVRECEIQGLYYQLIHTRSSQSDTVHIFQKLARETGNRFDYMIPVNMEMVDLGGASKFENINTDSQMYCEGKGFYRPIYLHVNPSGGVRTCMYAPGSGWLGNINTESLKEIAEKFVNNPVVNLFSNSSGSRSSLIERIYSQRETDLPKHPCALAATIAKTIEDKI
ncbi:MAG: MoaA/NifB/PqqE/SkfB family radical SAM enzyme [Desulforhopalus sp.]|jgi:MoaA/NifB/PqqE/SkfB family radical SAM enzyme